MFTTTLLLLVLPHLSQYICYSKNHEEHPLIYKLHSTKYWNGEEHILQVF